MKLRIGILGSRGIPNNYGGFEQFAEYLSAGLVQRGHEVVVYNSQHHSFQKNNWKGVQIVHCYDPAPWLGSAGQFIYDLNCIRDARKRAFDILLILGYTSSSVWGKFFPDDAVIITNMDGLEWKRTKYNRYVRRFIKLAEKLAVKHSDYLIADSLAIQTYLTNKYHKPSKFIPYGATVNKEFDPKVPENYGVNGGDYYMLMARMEPENNVETILDGFHQSASSGKFLAVGSIDNKFGEYLVNKYKGDHRIIFAGAIYNQQHVHNLRRFASIYFHGHSVGGTNPSLLEAMASQTLIAAHKNDFNETILGENALYFGTPEDVTELINHKKDNRQEEEMKRHNLELIEQSYSWNKIINDYEAFFNECKHP